MRLLTLIVLLLGGCSVPPLDVGERRDCPCAPGWTCDEATNECVVFGGPSDATPDGRTDVLVLDAQVPDAIVPDAVVPDAVIPDAVIPDADLVDGEPVIPDASVPDAVIPDARVPDARIPDAVVPDMNVPDANIPDAMVTSCPSGVFVCESFETTLTQWDTFVAPGAQLTQDDARANSGNQSLRLDIGTAQNAELRYNYSSPLFSGTLHIRAYFYIPSTVTNDFAFIAHKESAAPWQGASLGLNNQRLAVSNYNSPVNDYADSRPDTFPRDEWVCVSLTTVVSDGGQIRARAQNIDITAVGDTLPQTGLVQTSFGIISGESHPPYSIWIDDIAIDDSPLPCP